MVDLALGDASTAGYGGHRGTLISGKGQKMATLEVVVVASIAEEVSLFFLDFKIFN
jgi:hypothetical protein